MENSNSLFLALNNTDIQQLDINGNPINGTRIYAEDFKKGKTTVLRFIDGFLDGDLFDIKGNLIMQRPAVDSDGHQEYWRKNKIHRDGEAPAVYSRGFTEEELELYTGGTVQGKVEKVITFDKDEAWNDAIIVKTKESKVYVPVWQLHKEDLQGKMITISKKGDETRIARQISDKDIFVRE